MDRPVSSQSGGKAAEEVRRSEERYRSLFEHMLDGFAHCQVLYEQGAPTDFLYLSVNDSFERLTGLKQVTGKKVSEVIPGIHQANPELLQRYARVASTGQPERFETYVESLGIWFSISVYCPQKEQFVATFDNITERKQAEEAREQLAQHRKLALDAARMGWWHYDPKSGLLTGDERCADLLGISAQPLARGDFFKLIHPEDVPMVAAAVEAALDPQDPRPYSVEYRLGEGTAQRWIEAHGLATFEGVGESRRPTSLVGTAQDITVRKEFQAELQRLVAERTAKLQELVGELEHFSYTITHDMRAPLRAMQGFADMMQESCAECQEQEAKGFLRRIDTAAARMDLLITDALNYSRTVRQELVLAPVDAAALLRGMLDSYPELQPSKANIRLEGKIPLVMGNEAGLTQCFSNLLGNAVKFVRPGQKPEISLWAERREGWVRIWVVDNGIGISEAMLPRVFDMFSRGHSAHKYEGTGIGLALVRKVMDRMGGKVGVESEPGKGSRFWLELKPGDPRGAP